MKRYNFVYKTTFNDGRYYIGQHKTDNLDDNYFGSSDIVKDLVRYHSELYPKREILRYCNTQAELNHWEKFYIGDNYKNDPLCLNKINNCTVQEVSPLKDLHLCGEKNPMYGKDVKDYMTQEAIDQWRHNISESLKGHQIFANMTPEAKEEWIKKQSESHKGINTWESMTQEAKDERRKKQSKSMKGKEPFCKGKHRVYDENGKYHYE